ncbi:hypothetical protein GCM10011399_37450 [Subtercola lobariae]|uniref:Uncharacterized protein n=1 Tax=Subtercola lobariae TaxID=1588641 RepID=A0A917BH83_9MICO|nr:hypothetical protein GCM10011399_37450 [Subtercola lobariae]
MVRVQMVHNPMMAKTLPRAAEPTMSDPRPEHTPKPAEIDPDDGTEPDGTPVENPSGRTLILA